MRKASWMLAGTAMLALLATQTSAAELPGKFEGVTINAKLIGGQQYEALYSRIAEWEKATGA
jgi:multiple sugar transport system substrate-binding protein